MFIGHYGPAYAVKRWQPQIPIFVLFIAVQLVDVAWAVLVLLGIEKVRIVPGITATNPLDLYYMPYTHSLLAALIWSIAGGLVYIALAKASRTMRCAVAVGTAVFSHWILDLLVHRPDLPIYDDTLKVGLGLWNFPAVALALEAGSVIVGLALYLAGTRARDPIGRVGPWAFVVLMVGIQTAVFFGSPPQSANQAAVTGLIGYFVLAAIALWLDRHRAPAAAGIRNASE